MAISAYHFFEYNSSLRVKRHYAIPSYIYYTIENWMTWYETNNTLNTIHRREFKFSYVTIGKEKKHSATNECNFSASSSWNHFYLKVNNTSSTRRLTWPWILQLKYNIWYETTHATIRVCNLSASSGWMQLKLNKSTIRQVIQYIIHETKYTTMNSTH